MWYDWTYLIALPAIIFALIAQFRVKGTFDRYAKVSGRNGLTGADTAKLLLEKSGIFDVTVERVQGSLTDHYDPRSKTLRLSESVYDSKGLSAVGVAAHETGHAIQDAYYYAPLGLRSALVPVCGIGSAMAWPVVIIGFLVTQFSGALGMILINVGIILLAMVVIFSLITLPVEFNASARAVQLLESERVLEGEELSGARKVLSAAAMTYVAAAAVAVTQLIRVILLSRSRD